MDKHKTNVIRSIKDSLWHLQSIIIGIHTNPFNKIQECVIDEDEYTFTTIHIGNLLGLQITVYARTDSYGNIIKSFIKFPNNQTLEDMMDNPMIFDEWCKQNIK